jgi:hypothetical protein
MRAGWGGAVVLGLAVAASFSAVVRVRAASQANTSTQIALPPESATVSKSEAKAENAKGDRLPRGTVFRTSDHCVACHNGLKTSEGEDISIGVQWRASIMANASRDPYWQGSVRRESIDHPESKQAIQDECTVCHMPAVRMADRDKVGTQMCFLGFR